MPRFCFLIKVVGTCLITYHAEEVKSYSMVLAVWPDEEIKFGPIFYQRCPKITTAFFIKLIFSDSSKSRQIFGILCFQDRSKIAQSGHIES